MGRIVQWMSEDSATIVFYRFQFLWDLAFWVFARNGVTRRGTQWLLTRARRAGDPAPGRARAARRHRLGLPERDRGAGAAAAGGAPRRARARGDHRPGGDALLGEPGRRRPPDDPPGVGCRGARRRRAGCGRSCGARLHEAGVPRPARAGGGARRARAAARREGGARLRRRLGRGGCGGRGRGGARRDRRRRRSCVSAGATRGCAPRWRRASRASRGCASRASPR